MAAEAITIPLTVSVVVDAVKGITTAVDIIIEITAA
jgi:hypothetical protein